MTIKNNAFTQLKKDLGYSSDATFDSSLHHSEILNILKTMTIKEAVAFIEAIEEESGDFICYHDEKDDFNDYQTQVNFSFPINTKQKGRHPKPFFKDSRW